MINMADSVFFVLAPIHFLATFLAVMAVGNRYNGDIVLFLCVNCFHHYNCSESLLFSATLPCLSQVSGAAPPKPSTSFAHFGFDEQLMHQIRKSEYTQPTPIQCQV